MNPSPNFPRFSFGQQILNIATELIRAHNRFADKSSVTAAYGRAIDLTRISLDLADRYASRRELTRLQTKLAENYTRTDELTLAENYELLRATLQLTPESAQQLKYLNLA